jgi:peptide/nickel transport system permease protein
MATAAAAARPSPARRAVRRLGPLRLVLVGWLVVVAVAAIAGATVLAERSDESSVDVLASPSLDHPFGTDELGRDVLVRVLAGAAVSLQVSIVAVTIGLVVGGLFGTLAAISRRFGDEALMRTVDVFLAFPAIVLALLVSLLFGSDVMFVALIIGIVIAPQVARLIRGRLRLELREGYVAAERSTGASLFRILTVHVARNIAPPVAAYALLLLADAMLFEAALSYIGVGVQPPQASWGNMILDGQRVLVFDGWWVSVFPGIVLFLTVAALNLLADRRGGLAGERTAGAET